MMDSWTPKYFADVSEDDLFWETMSKEKVKICDMTDGHVFKVVRMLEKYNASVPVLMQERFDDLHKTHPEYFL